MIKNKLALIHQRDKLYDKYIETYNHYDKWYQKANNKNVSYRNRYSAMNVAKEIKSHLTGISAEMIALDNLITYRPTPEDTFYKLAEIY